MRWRRLLMLDLALAVALLAGVIQVRRGWKEFERNHRVETVQAEKETVRGLPAPPASSATVQDWTDISTKDPFSFDRNDVAIVAPQQTPTNKPKPVLFGMMSVGTERIAMLAPGQSGSRTAQPVKIGESLDGWQVVEIGETSVVVVSENGVRQTVIMDDPAAQVARVYERTGTAPAAPVTVIAPTPNASPAASPSSTAAPSTAGPPAPANQQSDDILLTPFGPVKRTRP